MFFSKRKSKSALTLIETVIVMAMIAILLSVAIPSLVSYFKMARVQKLDNYARTVFYLPKIILHI
ncbi:MAG: type IV pilin protein [Christensenellaceae bacterium]